VIPDRDRPAVDLDPLGRVDPGDRDASPLNRRNVHVRADMDVAADVDAAPAPNHRIRTHFHIIAERNMTAVFGAGIGIEIRAVVDEDIAPDADAVGAANDHAASKAHAIQHTALPVVLDGVPRGAYECSWDAQKRSESSHVQIFSRSSGMALVPRD